MKLIKKWGKKHISGVGWSVTEIYIPGVPKMVGGPQMVGVEM